VRLKLDENMDVRLAELLNERGFEADTVLDEDLSGAPDATIYDVCLKTGQTLITLDLDFSNPVRFPPAPMKGIIVLRPKKQVLPLVRALLINALPTLATTSPAGALWIVEPSRMRIYEPET
jgi:predicted nuclease of predicted toxin-antitoxin system